MAKSLRLVIFFMILAVWQNWSIMSELPRFLLQTTRPGQAMSMLAIQDEAVAMRQTLAATRSGQFARVVLIRDGGIAHRVIYDSNRGAGRSITIEADPARARGNRRRRAPGDWRNSARWLILFSLIMAVVVVAARMAFLS